jgi:cbb3-type cytochrome oxidase cytochrome c subunit
VPYSNEQVSGAAQAARDQALTIAQGLAADAGEMKNLEKKEIVALISYLQRLGKNPGVTNMKVGSQSESTSGSAQ